MTVAVSTGSVLDSSAQTLVNTVNCVGIMGKGIALEFKKRYPDMFKDYVARCARHEVRLGEPYPYSCLPPPWILNFPTKGHWRAQSKLPDIIAGLEYLEDHYRTWGTESLAVPALGCGNGGLQWNAVGPVLFDHLSRLGIRVELFAPPGTPPEELTAKFLSQSRMPVDAETPAPSRSEPAWVALVAVLARIEDEPYHCPINRRAFETIACFATMQGLPTGLKYSLASRGPSCHGIKAIVNRLAGDGVLRQERRGRTTVVRPGPEYARYADGCKGPLRQWEPRLGRVADLYLRMGSVHEANLVATVALTARELAQLRRGKPAECEVLHALRRHFSKRGWPAKEGEFAVAIRELATCRWIDVEPSPDLPLPDDLAVEL